MGWSLSCRYTICQVQYKLTSDLKPNLNTISYYNMYFKSESSLQIMLSKLWIFIEDKNRDPFLVKTPK